MRHRARRGARERRERRRRARRAGSGCARHSATAVRRTFASTLMARDLTTLVTSLYVSAYFSRLRMMSASGRHSRDLCGPERRGLGLQAAADEGRRTAAAKPAAARSRLLVAAAPAARALRRCAPAAGLGAKTPA